LKIETALSNQAIELCTHIIEAKTKTKSEGMREKQIYK